MSKKDAIDALLGNRKNTEIQEPVNKVKKATFDFDSKFHTDLKTFAAQRNKTMVDVVVAAVKEYMEKNK